ncbi:MAG TPA: hypothetical protein VIF60_14430 [Burkholderiaceae bacterium]
MRVSPSPNHLVNPFAMIASRLVDPVFSAFAALAAISVGGAVAVSVIINP